MDYKIKNDILKLRIRYWTKRGEKYDKLFADNRISGMIKLADICIDEYYSQPDMTYSRIFAKKNLENFIDILAAIDSLQNLKVKPNVFKDLVKNPIWVYVIVRLRSDNYQNYVIRRNTNGDVVTLDGITHKITENLLNKERFELNEIVLEDVDVLNLKYSVRDNLKKFHKRAANRRLKDAGRIPIEDFSYLESLKGRSKLTLEDVKKIGKLNFTARQFAIIIRALDLKNPKGEKLFDIESISDTESLQKKKEAWGQIIGKSPGNIRQFVDDIAPKQKGEIRYNLVYTNDNIDKVIPLFEYLGHNYIISDLLSKQVKLNK